MTRIEKGLAATSNHASRQTRLVHMTLDDILKQTAGLKFGWKTVLVGATIFVLGMLLESQAHLLYRWL